MLSNDIALAVHLWYLLDNPEHSNPGDLALFDNHSAVFYARQGRKFVSELLALGDFKHARNSQRLLVGVRRPESRDLHPLKRNLVDYIKS